MSAIGDYQTAMNFYQAQKASLSSISNPDVWLELHYTSKVTQAELEQERIWANYPQYDFEYQINDWAIELPSADELTPPSVSGYIQSENKFYDADIRIISESIPFNSYFAGAINTQAYIYSSYKKYGLQSYSGQLLMHEFGHYLQNKYGGSFWYNMNVVPTSLYNINTMDITTYRCSWTEVQANTMAYYYFHYPSFWDFNNYPVNFNYISDELKSALYYHKP